MASGGPWYPPDWAEIQERVIQRAGERCQTCGAPRGALGYRAEGRFIVVDTDEAALQCVQAGRWNDLIRVVLVVAHVDGDTTHNEDSNLRALCRGCHNTYDALLRAEHAKQTRRRKQIRAGQQEMGL
jgi:5-methylcytosine-specific restriction endonuclease McrA